MQEKKEADFRYGLVRVRENAESIAFYGGEDNELRLLLQRFRSAFNNLTVCICFILAFQFQIFARCFHLQFCCILYFIELKYLLSTSPFGKLSLGSPQFFP